MWPLTLKNAMGREVRPVLKFRGPEGIGSVMRPGRVGGPCEDAIFMDLQKGIFAVADGAGRAAGASGRLMRRFDHAATRLTGMDWAVRHPESRVPHLLGSFKGAVESMLADIPYGDAATFTVLKMLHCDVGIWGMLCHCGDSMIFRFESPGALRRITESNFWLAGRSRKVYQAEAFFVPPGTVFVLTTDGIGDLCFPEPPGLYGCLTRSIRSNTVDRVPEDLLARYGRSRQTVDDIAMIAVNPEHLKPSRARIHMDIHGVSGEDVPFD